MQNNFLILWKPSLWTHITMANGTMLWSNAIKFSIVNQCVFRNLAPFVDLKSHSSQEARNIVTISFWRCSHLNQKQHIKHVENPTFFWYGRKRLVIISVCLKVCKIICVHVKSANFNDYINCFWESTIYVVHDHLILAINEYCTILHQFT